MYSKVNLVILLFVIYNVIVESQWIHVLDYYNNDYYPGASYSFYKVVSFKSGECYIDETTSTSNMYLLSSSLTVAKNYYSNFASTPCGTLSYTTYTNDTTDHTLRYILSPYPLLPLLGSVYYERYTRNCSTPQTSMKVSSIPGYCLLDETSYESSYIKATTSPITLAFSDYSSCSTTNSFSPSTSCSSNTRHVSNAMIYTGLVWSVPALIPNYTEVTVPPFSINIGGYYEFIATIQGSKANKTVCPSATGCNITIPHGVQSPVGITLTILCTPFDVQTKSMTYYTTLLGVPIAPNITIDSVFHNNISLHWNATGIKVADYQYTIQVSTDTSTWADIQSNLTTLNSVLINLTPLTLYYVRVGSYLGGYPIEWSTMVSATTLQDPRYICSKECVHGTCINAACVCEEGYTGITCESDAPISNTNITVNPTLPTIVLSLGGKTTSFLMSDLIERDLMRNQVASLSLSKVNWTLTSQLNTTVTHPVTNEQLYSSSWTYKMISTNVSNPFTMTIRFNQFTKVDNSTLATYFPIQFAGIGINVTLGSLKYTMTITKWPFKSIFNTLELSNTIVPPLDDCGEYTVESVETRDNVQMMIGQGSGGTNVYTSLSSRALVDNVPRRILHQFVSNNDNTGRIVTESPFFTNTLVIDPELSLLISNNRGSNRDQCSDTKKKLTKEQIIGIAVGGAAFVLISVLAVVYYFKRRYDFYREGIKIKMVKISQTTAE